MRLKPNPGRIRRYGLVPILMVSHIRTGLPAHYRDVQGVRTES